MDVEEAICLLDHAQRIPFSVATSSVYPPVRNQTITPTIAQLTKQYNTGNELGEKSSDSTWLWHCNAGLSVRHWLGGENVSYRCFCPPSHYGDRCQYQNQRVTFTARLQTMDVRIVYSIAISLIDESKDYQQINSYHQYTTVFDDTCAREINTHLIYTKRVNNDSVTHSVRVDIYNRGKDGGV